MLSPPFVYREAIHQSKHGETHYEYRLNLSETTLIYLYEYGIYILILTVGPIAPSTSNIFLLKRCDMVGSREKVKLES